MVGTVKALVAAEVPEFLREQPAGCKSPYCEPPWCKNCGDPKVVLPTDTATRERLPLCTGVVDYFPLALAAIANCSLRATEQHHPGKPMHWDRSKSLMHADKIMKHLIDRGTFDTDGVRHSAKLAWRALALLQQELENDGGAPGRASKFPTTGDIVK